MSEEQDRHKWDGDLVGNGKRSLRRPGRASRRVPSHRWSDRKGSQNDWLLPPSHSRLELPSHLLWFWKISSRCTATDLGLAKVQSVLQEEALCLCH